ncbi:MAG: vitamin K epoxide reductase family protein [Anaerolineales bacterium]
MNTLKYFNIEQGGVPFLVVGDTYLVGSVDIPNQFPGLIDHYLAQGGVDWPAIPGLAEAINAPTPTEAPSATPVVTVISTALPTSITPTSTPVSGLLLSGSHTPSVGATFANDPLGNSLAVVVLVAMILSVGGAILVFQRNNWAKLSHSWGWLIPILCVIGLLVAGYLAYVETNRVEAICGPVGDCNTVQESEYARLFGILPIGILGMAGYGMILLAWVIEQFSNKRKAAYASLAILGMSGFGVLFSIYLTFLEPFVIGATCAWCLTSSIIMTALLWLSIFPGKRAYISLFLGEKHAFRKRSSQRTF